MNLSSQTSRGNVKEQASDETCLAAPALQVSVNLPRRQQWATDILNLHITAVALGLHQLSHQVCLPQGLRCGPCLRDPEAGAINCAGVYIHYVMKEPNREMQPLQGAWGGHGDGAKGTRGHTGGRLELRQL